MYVNTTTFYMLELNPVLDIGEYREWKTVGELRAFHSGALIVNGQASPLIYAKGLRIRPLGILFERH